jgi:hypothetical protein
MTEHKPDGASASRPTAETVEAAPEGRSRSRTGRAVRRQSLRAASSRIAAGVPGEDCSRGAREGGEEEQALRV